MEYSVTFTWTASEVVKIKARSMPEMDKKVNFLAEGILSQKEAKAVRYEATDEEGTTYEGWVYSVKEHFSW